MSERKCAIETGVIDPDSNVAALCIEGLANRFLSGEIEAADVVRSGTTITEHATEDGTQNACVSCDLCNHRVNVGSMPGGMRITITTGPDAGLPSTWLPEAE